MNKFRFVVELEVEVEAFDRDDAAVLISDYFGRGPLDDVVTVRKSTADPV